MVSLARSHKMVHRRAYIHQRSPLKAPLGCLEDLLTMCSVQSGLGRSNGNTIFRIPLVREWLSSTALNIALLHGACFALSKGLIASQKAPKPSASSMDLQPRGQTSIDQESSVRPGRGVLNRSNRSFAARKGSRLHSAPVRVNPASLRVIQACCCAKEPHPEPSSSAISAVPWHEAGGPVGELEGQAVGVRPMGFEATGLLMGWVFAQRQFGGVLAGLDDEVRRISREQKKNSPPHG